MDSSTFDRLSRSLASKRLTRRSAAASVGLGLAVAAHRALPTAHAQDATPAAAPEEGPSFLFVQLFEQGTWLPKPGADGTYLLDLAGSAGETLFFSDRPDRIVGTVETEQFLEALGFTPENPPNAAVVVRTPEGTRDVLLVELSNPIYIDDIVSPGGVRVIYEAQLLEAYDGAGLSPWSTEQQDQELPDTFTDISLFIDDCPDLVPANCMSGCDPYYYPIIVGDLGSQGMCWSWGDLGCVPCNGGWSGLNQMCDASFVACKGKCFTDHKCVKPP